MLKKFSLQKWNELIYVVFGIFSIYNVFSKASDVIENSVSFTTEKVATTSESTVAGEPTTGIYTDISPIDRSGYYHQHNSQPGFHGFWKKKLVWRPRWVKTWKEKKVYVAVWKKMWGPLLLNEWLPIPKPPPGWLKHGFSHGSVINTHTHLH